LEEFAGRQEESLFEGDCYVFDQRVAVTYGNKPSTTWRQKCHACRHPLSSDDIKREDYVAGISCRHCLGQLSEKQKDRFAQRQRQIQLALKNGRQHIHDAHEKLHKKTCRRETYK